MKDSYTMMCDFFTNRSYSEQCCYLMDQVFPKLVFSIRILEVLGMEFSSVQSVNLDSVSANSNLEGRPQPRHSKHENDIQH
jgi:hypothetical protein